MDIARNFFEFAAFWPYVEGHVEREFRLGETVSGLDNYAVAVVLTGSLRKRVRKFDVIGKYAKVTKQKATLAEDKPIEEKFVDEFHQGSVIEPTSFFVGTSGCVQVDAVATSGGTRLLLCKSTEGIQNAIKLRREKIAVFLKRISDFQDPLFPLRFRLLYAPKGERFQFRIDWPIKRLFLVFAGSFTEHSEVNVNERSKAVNFLMRSTKPGRRFAFALREGSVIGADYFFPSRKPKFATQEFIAAEDSWLAVADETLALPLEQFLSQSQFTGRDFQLESDLDVASFHHRAKTYKFFRDLKREAEAPAEVAPTSSAEISLVQGTQSDNKPCEPHFFTRALVKSVKSAALDARLRAFTYLVISKSPSFHSTVRNVFLGTRCGLFFAPTAMEAIKYVIELKQYSSFDQTRILVDYKFPDCMSVCAALAEITEGAEIIFVLSSNQMQSLSSQFPVISQFRNAGELRELLNSALA